MDQELFLAQMSVDDDHVASYASVHSYRRASVFTAPEKSSGFPTYYNPLHKTADAKDVYGIRPLNHGTLSFEFNAAEVPTTPASLPSPCALASPKCLPYSEAAECAAPSAIAVPDPAVSVPGPPVAAVDAVDAARDWHLAIRKTFHQDPKFIVTSPLAPTLFVYPQLSLIVGACAAQVTEGDWKLTRADQIGHWVEALAAAEDPSSAVDPLPSGTMIEEPDAQDLRKQLNGSNADEQDNPEFLRDFLELPLDWNLPRPGMIFSVTGSANSDFDLEVVGKGLGNWFKQRLHQFLARVIFGVAIKTQGWIIDGGSNVGIMKALGEAREHLMFPPSVPLIGMTSHMLDLPDCLHKRCPQQPRAYKVPPPPNPRDPDDKPCLDPNHSHFFFVGPKTETAIPNFGDENVFRRKFEVWHSLMSSHVGVMRVL